MSTRMWTAVVAVVAALITVVAGTTSAHIAIDGSRIHVAVETLAALISLLAGQLILSRYARSTQLADLLLGAALTLLAFGNLALSAIPTIVDEESGALATWGALLVRTLSAILLAAAAWAPSHPLTHPARAARAAAVGGGACVAVVVLAVAVAGDLLPRASPADGAWPAAVDGGPVVAALQVSAAVLYGIAAVGFMRRADRTGDALIHWLAIGCVLGAFSRLNYLIEPSLGSTAFVAGDALRLAFFGALLIAGVCELRSAERALADAAALRERQRIARDIHDGMAQDLAFIVQQGRAMRRRLGATAGIEQIVAAGQHALDESRAAVATLMRPTSQTLSEALAQTAREAAEREGSMVDTQLPPDVAVPASTQEVMVRVLREAVINAARHGAARRIRVELRDEPPLCLSVSDDGRGFDTAGAADSPGRYGLRSMAERVKGIGGELSIDSKPGRGTRVRMVLR